MGLVHDPDQQTVTVIDPVDKSVLLDIDRALDPEPEALFLGVSIDPLGQIDLCRWDFLGNGVRRAEQVDEILDHPAVTFLGREGFADRHDPPLVASQITF